MTFRFRFSLRTYLLLVGVLGVVIFPFAAEWRAVDAERQALKRFPTSIAVGWKEQPSMVMRLAGPLLKRFEPSAGKRVSSISFQYPGVVHLHRLAALRHLEKVEFTNNVEIAPLDKDPLVPVPSVNTVVIRFANLENGLQQLEFLKRFPNLRSLAIRESHLTPAAMRQIERAPIESLELYALSGWRELPPELDLSRLKRLRRLKVDNGILQTHPRIVAWLNSAPWLRHLILSGYSGNIHRIFTQVSLPELRTVELYSFQMSEADFVALLAQPQLAELTLGSIRVVGENTLHHLQCARLESLTLVNNAYDDDVIPELAQIKSLRRLELNEPLMQYASLDQLSDMPLLEELKVPAKVPASALPKLKGR